jgi:hypothetical protein
MPPPWRRFDASIPSLNSAASLSLVPVSRAFADHATPIRYSRRHNSNIVSENRRAAFE